MKIKASSNLRGELVLASVKKSLLADQQLFITDEQYHNDDVQKAMGLGLIELVEGTATPQAVNSQQRFYLVSMHRNTIVFPGVPGPIEPGMQFSLGEKAFYTYGVQQAIGQGLVELVGQPGEQSIVETTVETSADEILADALKNQALLSKQPKRPTARKGKQPSKPEPQTMPERKSLVGKKGAKVAPAKAAAEPKRGPKAIRPVGNGKKVGRVGSAAVEDDGIDIEIL